MPICDRLPGLGDMPDPEVLRGPVTVLVRAFYEGKIDRLLIACNQFVNTVSHEIEQVCARVGWHLTRKFVTSWHLPSVCT